VVRGGGLVFAGWTRSRRRHVSLAFMVYHGECLIKSRKIFWEMI
jgi:hypothetical protein